MDGEEKPRVIMATPTGYCYSDAENPQVYNLTAAMEIIGFPPKNLINGYQPINDLPSNQEPIMFSQLSWNHHHHEQQQNNRLVLDDDPSLRCVFGDRNEKQSQGSLSLSLTSSNLQPFNQNSRFGQPSSLSDHRPMMQQQFQIRESKYLEPAMELLNQICNLGVPESEKAKQKRDQSELGDDRTQPPPAPAAFALDLLELQRRKAKLFQMLQEVEGRYKHYCDQMKAVVSSFEAVVGGGAAAAYSTMAARAMSRHFRCLKDGIVGQIKATNKAMGEKDCAIPGATKGETPRLRILDVKLRQQRAFQQMGVAESHPWRPQRGLPEKAVAILRAWLFEHFLHPYPSEVDKRILARQTGLSRSQVSNWFINARVRLWKPMVEEMYMEDQKEKEPSGGGGAATSTSTANLDTNNGEDPTTNGDRKPTQDQLMIRTDSECLSSIINTPKNAATAAHGGGYGRGGDEMGAMQFDFSSYGGAAAAISYLPDAAVPSNYGGGGGVSLTLGLQQHGGGGVSSMFYARDGIEDCQTGDYSIFESENQSLQYRNLMGSQLLDDLAG